MTRIEMIRALARAWQRFTGCGWTSAVIHTLGVTHGETDEQVASRMDFLPQEDM